MIKFRSTFWGQILLIFFFVVINVDVTSANSLKEDYLIESAIETKIKELLKSLEPEASVSVKIKHKKEESTLPSTPFIVNGLTVSVDGQSTIQSIQVTIYTKKAKLSPEVINFIQQVVNPYGVKPQIKVKATPEVLLAESLRKAKNIETIMDVSFEKFLEEGRGVFKTAIGAIGVFLLVVLLNGYLNRKTIGEYFQSFKNDLKEIGTQVTQRDHVVTPREEFKEKEKSQVQYESPKAGRLDLNLKSLSALFYDCYWNELDNYASFLWSRLDAVQKEQLISGNQYLRDYLMVASLQEVQDMGYENDPSYLNPLPIESFNQHDLTTIIRKYPGILLSLSRLRTDRLQLSVIEKIEIEMGNGPRSVFSTELLMQYSPSSPRKIERPFSITLHSIMDETFILAKEGLPLRIKKGVPTLGWHYLIPDEAMAEILKSFSAKDLSYAWIGPESTLSKLEELLPKQKREILVEYKSKIRPSRDSRQFKEIHRLIIDQLTELENDQPDELQSIRRRA